ncbi:MAG: beta-ketoacyl synthase N-terminal-like domain-containing protein [Bacteroidia bacterium]
MKGRFCTSTIDDKALESEFAKKTSSSKKFTRLEKMCLLSVKEILETSKADPENKKTLLIISTTKGNIDILEGAYKKEIPEERVYLSEFAATIAQYFNFSNRPVVISNACISGLLGLIMAKRFLERGQYDNIIVCGGDIVSSFTLTGFRSLSALSNEPCRPFDKSRKGINLGEAAASILVSSNPSENCVELIGGSSSNDANHISGPSRTGEGLFQCLNEVLKEQPDFINAHGTATEYNDEMEAIAFSRMKLEQIPVNSFKSYYGHTLGAAGVLESILCMESLKQNKLIASAGFKETGTSVKLNVIERNVNQSLNSCLKTASGFGGCNASAIFKKYNG